MHLLPHGSHQLESLVERKRSHDTSQSDHQTGAVARDRHSVLEAHEKSRGMLGLQTQGLTLSTLPERLNLIFKSRFDLSAKKTCDDTYFFFCRSHRPWHCFDGPGAFKFSPGPCQAPPSINESPSSALPAELQRAWDQSVV